MNESVEIIVVGSIGAKMNGRMVFLTQSCQNVLQNLNKH